MTKQQIMDLQTQLNLQGANLKVDGIYGPKTDAALKQVGSNPMVASSGNFVLDLQKALNAAGANLKEDGIYGPKTDAAYKAAHATEVGNYAAENAKANGKPFSDEDRQAAFDKAMADYDPYYKAQGEYEKANTEDVLAGKQRGYEDFLRTSGEDFQNQKSELDQNAADQGVLFSGGRVQKENRLKNNFEANQASKLASTGSDIAGLARDFQYKYGNKSMGGLSNYYQLGGNVYNPKVATGGVKSGGLSSVYNAGNYNFQGTSINEQKAAAEKRAAGLLANKANKILPYNYQNQL